MADRESLLYSSTGLTKPRKAPAVWGRSQCMLDMVNLMVADVQGLGALTYIYCISTTEHGGLGISPSVAGGIMTAQGLLGVVSGPFLGHGIDVTSRKQFWLSVSLVVTAATYLMLDMYETTALVAVTLALQGAIAAIYPPAINSISIGMVGPYKMADRAARNEIAKHVGGIIAALLPIFFVNDDVGYHYFFLLVAAMALSGIVFVMLIRKEDIDDARARGGGLGAVENAMDIDKAAATPKNVATSMQAVTQEQDRRASLLNGNDVDDDAAEAQYTQPADPDTTPVLELLQRRDIVLFCLCVVFFHFANAAMLPQVGAKIDMLNNSSDTKASFWIAGSEYPMDGKNAVSMATIIAQMLMIPVAKGCGWLSKQPWAGSKRTLLVGYMTLPCRGICFALSDNIWTLLWFQCLDGVAAGAFGVLAVLIMSDLTQGTGRFSMMQGGLATGIGIGASASNGIGGWMVEEFGFSTMFVFLSVVSFIATGLLTMVETKELGMRDYEAEAAAEARETGKLSYGTSPKHGDDKYTNETAM